MSTPVTFSTSAASLSNSTNIVFSTANNTFYFCNYNVTGTIYTVTSNGTLSLLSNSYSRTQSLCFGNSTVYVTRDIAGVNKIDSSDIITELTSSSSNGSNFCSYNPVNGNVYRNAYWSNLVYKITSGGTQTSLGTIASPQAHIVDSSGNVFVSSRGGSVYKITTGDVISTFSTPTGTLSDMTVDSSGNLYVMQVTNYLIKKIMTDGTHSTFATLSAGISKITIDNNNNLYVTNNIYGTIQKIDTAGNVTTIVTGATGANNITYNNQLNALFYTCTLTNHLYYYSLLSADTGKFFAFF